MARGVNKAIIVGNLGRDPELRQSTNGDPLVTLNVATSDAWKDKTTGEQKEWTEWHRIVFFRRLAEIVGQYLQKGSRIYVEGTIRTRKWQDEHGSERYTTEIIASQMQMLDSRKELVDNLPKNQQNAPMQGTTIPSGFKVPEPAVMPEDEIPFWAVCETS